MAQLESFFWGIIAALGALVVELIVFIGFSAYAGQTDSLSFSQFFLIPGFVIAGASIEEIFKYIIISKRIEMLSLSRSYLFNSFFVGLGFFSTEYILISMSGFAPPTNILIEIAIIHIGTAGLIGYLVATKNPKKIGTFLLSIIIATLVHAAYNLLILDRTFILNYAIFALLGLVLFLNLANIIRINNKLAQH